MIDHKSIDFYFHLLQKFTTFRETTEEELHTMKSNAVVVIKLTIG